MNNTKDNYDTIGLDDNIITGATKITLNENKDDAFKGVKATEEKVDKKTSTEDKKEDNSKMDILSKVKGFFKFTNEEEIKQPQVENTQNSCKDRLLKKLQDNIEVEKSYQTFFILLALGLGLLCLSLMFLPVIILSPYKFVSCFSFGSLLILASFIFVYGTKSYFETLFSKSRFVFTILFLTSIVLGIIFSWSEYFFFSLICSMFQLISLIVFTLSFIPGGRSGISFIGGLLSSPFTNLWMRFRGQSYLPS
jgi:hypothetical protein